MIARRISNLIRTGWIDHRPVTRSKIVGIGLPKSGTRSLGYCFRRLGFKNRSYDMELALSVKRNNLLPALKEAEQYEAFEDWPWFEIYRELDQRFPHSKFILTLRRDTETYVASLKRHHDREGIRNKDFVKPHWWNEVHGVEPSEWDYDKSAQRYERHKREVLEYFGERVDKDLLIVCWENGDDWSKLCSFLNKRVPNEAFPHLR